MNNVYLKNKRSFKEAMTKFFTVTLPDIADSLVSKISDEIQILRPVFLS
ncbi:hypothetical protein [Candidatus Enterovibrio escicola]|uniref:Mobile element protein n=1 Tax=Candidatus Enterovibrio escicola TaxID=1927127 RepID=A0A2A5T756_9GAMM|nr:hypothetical protein [Candidatus Enterovibrio escacola]PCS23966.1 hypothetical protein BTN49_0332 [Candidatus Enterovibrio escacola]